MSTVNLPPEGVIVRVTVLVDCGDGRVSIRAQRPRPPGGIKDTKVASLDERRKRCAGSST